MGSCYVRYLDLEAIGYRTVFHINVRRYLAKERPRRSVFVRKKGARHQFRSKVPRGSSPYDRLLDILVVDEFIPNSDQKIRRFARCGRQRIGPRRWGIWRRKSVLLAPPTEQSL